MEVLKLGKQYVIHHQLMSLMAEIVLDRIVRECEMERLYKEIDHALDERNKERFLQLTDELQVLLKN